jgi:hypothetical protein
MIRLTTRTIERAAWPRPAGPGDEARRGLDALDKALEQVEQLLLDDVREVPYLLQEEIRHVVDRVDVRLGYTIDQLGSRAVTMQDIIYTAQAIVMKAISAE